MTTPEQPEVRIDAPDDSATVDRPVENTLADRPDNTTPDNNDLIDYPAVAPETTQRSIDNFLKACKSIKEAHSDSLRTSRIRLAVSLARVLMDRRDALETLLEQGDLWLKEHPEDIEESEPAWFEAEAEYRAIWDALREGARVAFGPVVPVEQARLLGVA